MPFKHTFGCLARSRFFLRIAFFCGLAILADYARAEQHRSIDAGVVDYGHHTEYFTLVSVAFHARLAKQPASLVEQRVLGRLGFEVGKSISFVVLVHVEIGELLAPVEHASLSLERKITKELQNHGENMIAAAASAERLVVEDFVFSIGKENTILRLHTDTSVCATSGIMRSFLFGILVLFLLGLLLALWALFILSLYRNSTVTFSGETKTAVPTVPVRDLPPQHFLPCYRISCALRGEREIDVDDRQADLILTIEFDPRNSGIEIGSDAILSLKFDFRGKRIAFDHMASGELHYKLPDLHPHEPVSQVVVVSTGFFADASEQLSSADAGRYSFLATVSSIPMPACEKPDPIIATKQLVFDVARD